MKKTTATCAFIAAAFVSYNASAALYDAFLPANEPYSYNETLGLVTRFCGGVGSDTCMGIRPSGRVWENGTLVPKYNFAGWASGYSSYEQGTGITGDGTEQGANHWTNVENALGKPTISDTNDVLVLGDGGSVTLTFDAPIVNGTGYDFAVFENSLNDTFLEFATVSVSTDGIHFVTFPHFYLGTTPVGSDSTEGGGVNDPTLAYNLGSKYRIGYGNGYDLAELESAYLYSLDHLDNGEATETSVFSAAYMSSVIENYAYIDLDNINYVKLTDIIGDGNTLDSAGNPIYDAYPTTGTPGFDLSGVGVINQQIPEPSEFAILLSGMAAIFAYSRRSRNKK